MQNNYTPLSSTETFKNGSKTLESIRTLQSYRNRLQSNYFTIQPPQKPKLLITDVSNWLTRIIKQLLP